MNHNISHYKNRQKIRDSYKLNKENVIDNNQEKISRFSSFLRECLRRNEDNREICLKDKKSDISAEVIKPNIPTRKGMIAQVMHFFLFSI